MYIYAPFLGCVLDLSGGGKCYLSLFEVVVRRNCIREHTHTHRGFTSRRLIGFAYRYAHWCST